MLHLLPNPRDPNPSGCPRVPCSLRGVGIRGSPQPGQEGRGKRPLRGGPCSLPSHAVLRLLPTTTLGPAAPTPPPSALPAPPIAISDPGSTSLEAPSPAPLPSPSQPRPRCLPLSGPPSLPASSVPQPFLLTPAGPPSSIGRSSRQLNIKTLAICASIRETMSLAKGTFSLARMVSMLM